MGFAQQILYYLGLHGIVTPVTIMYQAAVLGTDYGYLHGRGAYVDSYPEISAGYTHTGDNLETILEGRAGPFEWAAEWQNQGI